VSGTRARSRLGFTLTELLVALGIFTVLLTASAFCVHRLNAEHRQAQLQRDLRQEADAAFAEMALDFEEMPLRYDLDYHFTGEPALACAFLSARPGARDSSRDLARVAYRVGLGADGRWAGLQRAQEFVGWHELPQGLRPPPGLAWPAAIDPALPFTPLPPFPAASSPRTWPPVRLLGTWPAERRDFQPLSPWVVGLALAYQLRQDVQLSGGGTIPAGSWLADPPLRERPPGSGDWFVHAEDLGAVLLALAFLPPDIQSRLTTAELSALSEALRIPTGESAAPELPVEYWERRAGPRASAPLPTIPEPTRRALRFQQRIVIFNGGR
jgi:prepilin-type N-terminal cleavage/methylation domain-containing protein